MDGPLFVDKIKSEESKEPDIPEDENCNLSDEQEEHT